MILIILAAVETTKIVESQSVSLPGCPDRCGDVKIPYPFGTSQGCYLSEKFSINCSQSNSQLLSPTPFLSNGNLQITNISLEGELGIMHYGARDCYDEEGMQVINNRPRTRLSNFHISSAKNKFTAVGCDTYAIISGYRGETEYITGCISSCDRIDSYTTESSCSGVSCCQTSIPSGLKNITVGLSSFYNHTFVHKLNPCSYAFVVVESKFNFSRTSFRDFNDTEMVPIVLNWAIGEGSSCDETESREDFACKGNISKCVEASNGPGYLCQCLPGYEGNPYLSDGCQGD
ncbi:hypothetical protein FEM48_Zijuj01G0101800 [Ziziphus jujuba var. spinosa]|uniref:Wall-associated receptor kinase 2-like n=1 Tax=Ziziphus jujuba var. spinosa TaxID=714518 RepID=A0A978W0M9_ZIZJJ|nr:hypothetical protein FEM48_Zijuj01G0101800 [Ziziphus jujuba var. spinosa]